MIYQKEDKKYRPGAVGKVDEMVDVAKSSRGTFEQDLAKWFKLRMRVKKEKSYPFPGCSNMRLPTLDIKIKKLKSQIRNGVLGVRPVVQVIPTPSGTYEKATQVEKFLDHLIMDIMGYENKFIITVDQALEQGFYLNEPYWKLEIIDRRHQFDIADVPLQVAQKLFSAGSTDDDWVSFLRDFYSIDTNKYVWAENFAALKAVVAKITSGVFKCKFSSKDVVCNYPDVGLVEPLKCFVRNDGGYDVQTQPYIVTESWMSLDQLKSFEVNNGWNIGAVSDVINAAEIDTELESVKDAQEGITSFQKTGKIKIYKAQGWIDGKKKMVITAPDFSALIKEQPLQLPSGKYNLVKFYHELRDDRWYHHRGLPEILEDLVKEIDVQHMQKIDRQTIVNSPMFLYRAGFINKSTVQFSFGQGIPVNGMQPLQDVFQQVDGYNQAADFSYDREQQVLKADIDEYTGQIDFTLSQQLNRREPRTAQEVQAQTASAAMVSSLDLSLFRKSFEELANIVWELWCEYGDDEVEFNYFGEGIKESIKLSKEDIQGKYLVKVRANDENTNSETRVAKAQTIMQAVSNPIALQMGIVTPINIVNAYKRFYQELGVPNSEEFYTLPQPQPPGVPEKTHPKFSDLEELEQAQVLQQLGIQPNVGQRIEDKRRKVQNEKTDNITNVINAIK